MRSQGKTRTSGWLGSRREPISGFSDRDPERPLEGGLASGQQVPGPLGGSVTISTSVIG